MPKYKRILLKLSGEALMGDGGYGVHPDAVATVADEVRDFWGKLFLGKLVDRGELVQKNAEQWAKDLGARLR